MLIITLDKVVFRLDLHSFYSRVFSTQRGCLAFKSLHFICPKVHDRPC